MSVVIIGHFGGNDKFNDGQTVKTIAVYDALRRYGVSNVKKIDTYYIRNNPIKFCLAFLCGLIKYKKYIVLVSINGRRILFPFLCFMSRFMGKEIYHYAIGGRLAKEVNENHRWKKYISSFEGNWVESIDLADQLQKLGIKNAVYLPNFKKLGILTENELCTRYQEPYRFCTFSRVIKEKGIEDAITAIQTVNSEVGKQVVTLDIYGSIGDSYLDYFDKVIESADSCKYQGVISANKSVEVLKNYYALLFPSYWKGEGMPGTIIDAFSSGIPVIARRWQYCDEMIQHKKTGYIYDFESPEKLKDMILYAIEHVDETVAMKVNCLNKSKEYSEECVIKKIIGQMQMDI